MKKILVTAVLSVFSFASFAFDFSGIISDGTSLKFDGNNYDTPILKQTETFNGSFSTPIGKNGKTFFTAEGSVQHKLDATLGENKKYDNNIILDCTLFKIGSTINLTNSKTLSIAAGRYFYADMTGVILVQPNDGLYLGYNSNKFCASVYGGYTGLQNVKNVQILTSKGKVWAPSDERKVYDFTAPYAVGALTLSAPYLFANQTVSFEAMGVFNFGGPGDLKDDDRRLYGTLCLSGPFTNALFYTLSGTVNTFDFSKIGLLGKFRLDYFAPVKNGIVSINAVYASGENGSFSAFRGVTKLTSCSSANENEALYSGIIKAGIGGSILPCQKVLLSLAADAVFRMPEDSCEYYGFQVSGGARFKIFSDLSANITITQFTAKEKSNSRTEFALGLSLAI